MATTQPSSSPGGVEQNKRSRGKDLTPCLRAEIMGARIAGASYRKVAKIFDLPVTTVRTTIKMADQRVDHESRPRSGRPEMTSPRDKRQILRLAKSNPNWTYARLLDELHDAGLTIGKHAVVRLLNKEGIAKGKKRKRLPKVPSSGGAGVNDK